MTDRGSRTALIAVVNGRVYEDYAAALFDSARRYFKPTAEVETLMLPGPEGWPWGTLHRWRTVLEHWSAIKQRFTYVWLIDADALFEEPVGDEINPPYAGFTATVHPGYVGKPFEQLPYETRPEYACCVKPHLKPVYYCGGFTGGHLLGVKWVAEQIVSRIDADLREGRVARWHDESAANSVYAERRPSVTLSPAYCHPDRDEAYRAWWPEEYPRRIVMLDKSAEERGER